MGPKLPRDSKQGGYLKSTWKVNLVIQPEEIQKWQPHNPNYHVAGLQFKQKLNKAKKVFETLLLVIKCWFYLHTESSF